MSKKLLAHIKPRNRITSKVEYETVWIDHFKDRNTLGECRPDQKQIVIGKDQSPSEAFKTYLHEIIHAIDLETDGPNLTEKQVRKLEIGFYRFLKLNKFID